MATAKWVGFMTTKSANGKLYFTVTREGKPLRMRRYVYSESFAAIANAAFARGAGDSRSAEDAVAYFDTYLTHSFEPGRMPPKVDTATRPLMGIGPEDLVGRGVTIACGASVAI